MPGTHGHGFRHGNRACIVFVDLSLGCWNMHGDVEADQADQHHQHAPGVEELHPRLTQEQNAGDHQRDGSGAEILLVEFWADHLRMAPKLMPRSRWLRSRKVKMATGSRNSTVPAAMTVQSWRPVPTWLGMKGGAVCARLFVMISAKAYSFQAVMKQKTAVAAMPVAASGMTILKNASIRVKPTTRYMRNIGIATTTGGNMRVDRMKKRRSASPLTLKREKP